MIINSATDQVPYKYHYGNSSKTYKYIIFKYFIQKMLDKELNMKKI